MDRYVWSRIVAAVRSADRSIPRDGRRPRYRDALIVKMLCWSVAHDRPLCWACDPTHYHGIFRPGRLPSVSQFCRRVKTPRIQALMAQTHQALARADRPIDLLCLDGMALPISDYSTDPQAADGRGRGRFQRGYKLHVCVRDDDRIAGFQVHPMNVAEQTVARNLLDQSLQAGQLVLADSNYDSNGLYQRCQDRHAAMLTPLKGRSRCPRHRRRMSAARLNALMIWEQAPEVVRGLLRERDRVERVLAALCGHSEGLKGLPSWVRRLDPVRRWVAAKIILYHARLNARRRPAA